MSIRSTETVFELATDQFLILFDLKFIWYIIIKIQGQATLTMLQEAWKYTLTLRPFKEKYKNSN